MTYLTQRDHAATIPQRYTERQPVNEQITRQEWSLHWSVFWGCRLFFFVSLLTVCSPQPADAANIDWNVIEKEAGVLLSRSIQIDTSNPPGNETAAANFWQKVLAQEGIDSHIYESAPNRGIVYARLKGNGKKKALILLHHLDVVPADPEEWDIDPFGGIITDGYVHGRGAIDCKGVAVVQFLAVALLKRTGMTLDRDIIFLGTGDEEAGGQQGAGWFVEHHFDLIRDAEFLLTEGGGIRQRDGKRSYRISVAEKAPCWIELTATGPAGHGASPVPETAVNRLVRALEKIRRYETAFKVVPAVQAYFTALAEYEDAQTAEQYRSLEQSLKNETFRKEFTANRGHNALVRNTISLTVLNGSPKTNIVPASASAQLDCRLLPGEDPQQFIAMLKKIVGDPNIQFSTLLNFPSVASDPDTPLFHAIHSVANRRDPHAPVLPSVLGGFTDTHYFREKGIVSYGFSGLALKSEDSRGVHGLNERMPLSALRDAIQVMLAVIQSIDTISQNEGDKTYGH